MSDAFQSRIHRVDFQHWLEIGAAPLVISHSPDEAATFLKLSKLPEIDYIYGTSTIRAGRISWQNALTFCGVYDQRSQRLYLADEPLTSIVDGITTEEQDADVYVKKVCNQINDRIETIIANDRNNLSIKDVSGWQAAKNLKYYRECGAREEALQLFFEGKSPYGQFRSDYALDGMPEAAFIAWLQNPALFIQMEAEQYIKSHQEHFLEQFLKNDALLAEYQALMQDTSSPLHTQKAITDAVRGCGAKTVTVTVQRAGEELTFKAAADSLTGRRNYYSTLDVAAPDRRLVELLFGRVGYCAEDITKITYGRNTIYEAQPVQTEEMGERTEMEGMSFG